MLGKGSDGLCKAPTKEERRKRKAKRREGSDQAKLIDLASINTKTGGLNKTLNVTYDSPGFRLLCIAWRMYQ